MLRRWTGSARMVAGLVLLSLLAAVTLAEGVRAQQAPPPAGDQAYLDWFQGYRPQLAAAAQAVPVTLDLGNANWRREQVLALDSWGTLMQQARDTRAAGSTAAVHSALLDAVDHLDRARRLLLIGIATGQDPGPDFPSELR